ncbi:YpsA SLOG family protein [Deferribacter desulfuricans]|uniref:YpsA SLOG family protein n=1 Tax=Deferribacter desulfuricans TaxID=197162 RepID=UPI000A0161CD
MNLIYKNVNKNINKYDIIFIKDYLNYDIGFISGFQTGIDYEGLKIIDNLRVKCSKRISLSGFTTYKNQAGEITIDNFSKYTSIVKLKNISYNKRTVLNLTYSDITLIFADQLNGGTLFTYKQCKNKNKKVFLLDKISEKNTDDLITIANELADYTNNKINKNKSIVINIAGNRLQKLYNYNKVLNNINKFFEIFIDKINKKIKPVYNTNNNFEL